ncbi:hypothetical protein C2845_PM08G06100 [Panicum miliaceum]|uniref:Hexosyltransferase n=1 Tax=Panicum miliaceum TaxID=4540 RepID=A0A3L6QXB9_PANMI|nr:hypothetical protein C2845_PM08G06100 [Panicum miliaceum]
MEGAACLLQRLPPLPPAPLACHHARQLPPRPLAGEAGKERKSNANMVLDRWKLLQESLKAIIKRTVDNLPSEITEYVKEQFINPSERCSTSPLIDSSLKIYWEQTTKVARKRSWAESQESCISQMQWPQRNSGELGSSSCLRVQSISEEPRGVESRALGHWPAHCKLRVSFAAERKGRRFLSGGAAPVGRQPVSQIRRPREKVAFGARVGILCATAFQAIKRGDPWDGPAEGCQASSRRIANESKKCWHHAKLSVDGLVKCEKWIQDDEGRSEESKTSWWLNRLIGRTRTVPIDWPYPFVEDPPHGRNEINVELKKEAEFFGDIVIVPFMDSYDLVVLKTIAICEYAVHVVSARYIMKCDDDTFVRLESVMAEVKKIRSGMDYPIYANGPGYVISSNIADAILSEFLNHKLRLFKMEDVSMGMWVERFNLDA